MATIQRRRPAIISLATMYADQSDDALVIPEDLTALSNEELAALTAQANEAFDALYGDGQAELTDDEYATLAELTTGIEALATENARRDELAAERRTQVDELAQRRAAANSTPDPEGDPGEDDEEDEGEDTQPETEPTPQPETDEVEPQAEVEPIAASGRREISVNLGVANRRARRAAPKPATASRSMRDVAFAAAGDLGVSIGQGLDWGTASEMLSRRLNGFSKATYAAAASRNQHIRETHPLMNIRREFTPDLRLTDGASRDDVEAVMKRARDMARLPGGALTAAGWCAPSEVSYALCTTASRDGLFSLPEIGISRGGIMLPTQPSFADLYDEIGFHFTEADAEGGKYTPGTNPGDPNVAGPKPCYELPCPTWEDYRLEGDGICLTADLIQQRGYPEGLAWAEENALIAHDHKVSAGRLAKVIAGSTAVSMTAGTVGAAAPILAAIEIEAEAIRYASRLGRNVLLEGVFPYWVRGAIRQDLSVRLGMRDFDVTDAMIDSWFTQRGIVVQYVYDWQMLASNAIVWPTSVKFLIYEAGAWVSGVDDIATLNSVYDSTQLGMNKYTALFTEDAWLVAPACGESRVVTVPICADGTTHAGVLLNCDLTPTAAA